MNGASGCMASLLPPEFAHGECVATPLAVHDDVDHLRQQFRASGLNLVIAAIVYWNSTYIADAVAHLRATGDVVPAALLAHTTTAELGAHRPLGRFPLGPRCCHRCQAAPSQPPPRQGRRLISHVLGPFDPSVVRLYEPNTASLYFSAPLAMMRPLSSESG